MPETKSIADVIGACGGLQSHEAVAIIQQLITRVEEIDVELTRQGPPSLGDVRLGGDGSIVGDNGAARLSILDAATLFEAMLPRGGKTHVPGALRYTIARALGEVDAPQFHSTADFSAALKRHEQGDRKTVVRELYCRTLSEPRLEPPIGHVGLNPRRWLLGGAAAVVMSFGVGYIVADRVTPRAARYPEPAFRAPVAILRADPVAPRADADPAREIALATSDVERSRQFRSMYTPLIGKDCSITQEDTRTGSFVKVCPGVAGFRLVIASDPERISVTVVTRDERAHPLVSAQGIPPGASSLGTKAEWRFIYQDGKVTPVALIVRVYKQDTDSRFPRRTSYLAVAKLTPTEICVTDRIPAAASANEEARRASVVSATRACLKPA
jgi:hypothetical protein